MVTEAALTSPSFVVISDRCRKNCDALLRLCKQAGCAFRPHLKTHKCVPVADLQVRGDRSNPVIVSTLAELRHFVANGFTSVLYAVPFEPSKSEAIAKVAMISGINLSLYAECEPGIQCVSAMVQSYGLGSVRVFLAVDASSYNREGVDPTSDEAIRLATALGSGKYAGVEFAGLYSHSGNAYNCPTEARAIGVRELAGMVKMCRTLALAGGIAPPVVSVGSTPSYKHLTAADVTTAQKEFDGIQWPTRPGSVAATASDADAVGPEPSSEAREGTTGSRPDSTPFPLPVPAAAAAGAKKARADVVEAPREDEDRKRARIDPDDGTGGSDLKAAAGQPHPDGAGAGTGTGTGTGTAGGSLPRPVPVPGVHPGGGVCRLELHPGNYSLFDRQQVASGACSESDIACYVMCRVIGSRPDGSVLVDGGGMALHKDSGGKGVSGWGAVLGDPELEIVSVSQEVAVLKPRESALGGSARRRYELGDPVRILPNHSCMAAAQHPEFHFVESAPAPGDDPEIVASCKPAKFW